MRIGGSILLLAFGAILAFAVTLDPSPLAGMVIKWDVVGVILMAVGVLGLLWSFMVFDTWRDRHDDQHAHARPPVDRERIIER